MYINARLKQLRLILQEFSNVLWPLVYIKSLFFHNIFGMVGILCKFCLCFGTVYKIKILEITFDFSLVYITVLASELMSVN